MTIPSAAWGDSFQNYSGFSPASSSDVAGLVATSIWQFARPRTLSASRPVSKHRAHQRPTNDWRIARAEILGKNLSVLRSRGRQTADQRFGVLLSAAPGEIHPRPELAVFLRAGIGPRQSDYMVCTGWDRPTKNYTQLEQAFGPDLHAAARGEKRAEVCKDDQLADRSEGIAQLVPMS